eukprot:CAMPEP_0196760150 /NCGR_PEP_ID=MMETSP1091-20130531/105067_1 /TAXON_ID=302021 /ORGANISM="Rhodomonas sp., Strain CCMP768" /LENGTH=141 /DNA_ID=CAMNT_0042109019 /DNA_START=381 /DNA_END=805 /DNA_ORIENTATION=+
MSSNDLAPSAFTNASAALTVPAAIAGNDEVGDAARLEEGLIPHTREVSLRKVDDFHQSDPDDRALAVLPEAQPVAEPCSQRHNVLESSADLDAVDVVGHSDAEQRVVEDELEQLTVRPHPIADRGLAEGAFSNLSRQIGAH